MRLELKGYMLLVLAIIIIIGVSAQPAHAVWHALLDEHFNKDQQNQNLRWPWFTDMRNGIRWHWNPWPPHFRAERPPPRPSDYCWGVQDFIYCTRITPQADIKQSLWCAYTNENQVNSPRWPEDDDYMPLQNAWVWWGPCDLSDAVSAAVTYWLYLDLDHHAQDSLSVCVVNDFGMLRTQGAAFTENVPIGRTYSTSREADWIWQVFYLDSLVVNGDEDELVSMLGEEEVYVAWVWHSSRWDIAGKGAFIDDVVFSWDDGLFDLLPIECYIGYEINEDSTSWGDVWPDEGDEIQFKLDYRCIGVEETPEFTIDLLLDGEIIFSDELTAMGDDDTTYTITADTTWTVTYGEHVIRWEVDSPLEDEGRVEEGNEGNNFIEFDFNVIFNPSPEFEILAPEIELDTLRGREDEDLIIEYTISDTLEDEEFRLFFYWTTDTSDMTRDPELIWDVVENYGWIGRDFEAPRGQGRYTWPAETYSVELDSGVVFWTIGVATDGFPNNNTVSISPGQYIFLPEPLGISDEDISTHPLTFGITETYPNPFNDAINVNFSLEKSSNISLGIYDMTGRHVKNLIDGYKSSGHYQAHWIPDDISAGVYFIRLDAAQGSKMRKVVYMP